MTRRTPPNRSRPTRAPGLGPKAHGHGPDASGLGPSDSGLGPRDSGLGPSDSGLGPRDSGPATRLALLLLAALIFTTLLAYQPVWSGGILWDDDGHLTRADLASASGLSRIWFEPGATQQYYPVVHTAFWILNGVWGHHTTGYHLVNILLHATSAWLLWVVLMRLAVPGATLAAFVFALHPVHVESVAWITELKNVLSGTLYLSALPAYLRFDEERKPRWYAIAFLCFAAAALSKTVTVTLPAALLVLAWWRRGRVDLARDVKPLVPFFALGIVAGLVTVWVERTYIGAQGAEFELSLVQRSLLAGTVPWFYLGKLLWPANLIFIYPRWTIDPAAVAWWLPLAATVSVLIAAAAVRHRTRGPLTVVLLFLGTLFPALGFFNVYPFRFSFVADHFQYLASLAIIAGVCALIVRAALKGCATDRGTMGRELVLVSAAGLVLGFLTWQTAHAYADAETLYRTTIARNPGAWIAYNNLASLLLAGDPPRERIQEGIDHLERALSLKPDYAEAHYNLGTALERLERRDEAIAAYQRSLQFAPGERRTLQRLAAVSHDRATALLEQGIALEEAGRFGDALQSYTRAAEYDTQRAGIPRSIGRVYQRMGRVSDAAAAYERALQLDPQSFEIHNDLGVLLAQNGQLDRAVTHFRAAVQIRPSDEAARRNLAQAEDLLSRRK